MVIDRPTQMMVFMGVADLLCQGGFLFFGVCTATRTTATLPYW